MSSSYVHELGNFRGVLEVVSTLRGRRVLVTGGTGFIGKLLVEKLLRCIPDVKLFLLTRPESKAEGQAARPPMTPRQRWQDILLLPFWELLRKQVLDAQGQAGAPAADAAFEAWFFSRVTVVQGDLLGGATLGISQQDRLQLAKEVDAVIHCAASTKFRLRLDKAVQINVDGPLALVSLIKQWNQERKQRPVAKRASIVYCHVSTLFVGANEPHRAVVMERLPLLPWDSLHFLQRVRSAPLQEFIEEERRSDKKWLSGWPNTYTLTKALAEHLLAAACQGEVPLIILRPGITGPCWREPLPGWTDTFSGVTAGVGVMAVGVVQNFHVVRDNLAEVVPVDMVTNALIVAAASLLQLHASPTTDSPSFPSCFPSSSSSFSSLSSSISSKTVPRAQAAPFIMHVGTGTTHPVSWNLINDWARPYFRKHPPRQRVRPLWQEGSTAWLTLFRVRRTLEVDLPVLASGALAAYKPSRFKGLQKQLERVKKVSDSLEADLTPFTTRYWNFDAFNTRTLQARLSPEEQNKFPLVFTGDWRAYIELLCHGLITFLLNKDHLRPSSSSDYSFVAKPESSQKSLVCAEGADAGVQKGGVEQLPYPVDSALGSPPWVPNLAKNEHLCDDGTVLAVGANDSRLSADSLTNININTSTILRSKL